MARTRRKVRKQSVVFELYAVHLLLCSPHPLSRAWAEAKDQDVRVKSQAALAELPLSKETRDIALNLMVALKHHRGFFKGIADTLKFSDLYAGNEPHPPERDAAQIIKALQALGAAKKRA
jgi:hypothetical protein